MGTFPQTGPFSARRHLPFPLMVRLRRRIAQLSGANRCRRKARSACWSLSISTLCTLRQTLIASPTSTISLRICSLRQLPPASASERRTRTLALMIGSRRAQPRTSVAKPLERHFLHIYRAIIALWSLHLHHCCTNYSLSHLPVRTRTVLRRPRSRYLTTYLCLPLVPFLVLVVLSASYLCSCRASSVLYFDDVLALV